MIIAGGLVYGSDFEFHKADVITEGGLIKAVVPADASGGETDSAFSSRIAAGIR